MRIMNPLGGSLGNVMGEQGVNFPRNKEKGTPHATLWRPLLFQSVGRKLTVACFWAFLLFELISTALRARVCSIFNFIF